MKSLLKNADVSKLIKFYMREKNLSIMELGRLSGLGIGELELLLENRKTININNIARIASALKIEIALLFQKPECDHIQ